MASEDDLIRARRAKFEKLERAGTRAFPNTFRADEASREAALAICNDDVRRASLPGENELQGSEATYTLYGRVVARRGPFVVLRTPYGDMQALVRKDRLREAESAQFAALDLSDFVGVRGPLIRTGTGAAAVRSDQYEHVSKALLPPPDKWHGLTDVEKRYRERYVDLTASPEVARLFRARSQIVKSLRAFLDSRSFLEVETPLLHPLRGGATARPFRTHHNALDLELYLRIAPELYLKRLLVGGLDRVYELGRCFRNEGVSARHNPEFTMLEFYMAYATADDLTPLAEQLVRSVDQTLTEQFPELSAQRPFTLEQDFKRVTMRNAITERLARSSRDLPATPFDQHVDHAVLSSPERLSAVLDAQRAQLPKAMTAPLEQMSNPR